MIIISSTMAKGALLNGALFSIFSGLCEYYLSRRGASSYVLWFRVATNTTIGFLYGAGFTYYWKMPALISFVNGFYGGQARI